MAPSIIRRGLLHEDVMKGGTLELFMGDRPNKKWGVGEGANPPSGEFVD